MPKLMQRIRRAVAIIRDSGDVIGATVRPADIAMGGRYALQTQRDLVRRYSKWVKVAGSRNAAAVAGLPLRVYRAASGNAPAKRSAFKSRAVSDLARANRAKSWGRKAVAMASDAGDVEEVIDPTHPLVAIIQSAWPGGSGFELIEQTELHLGLAGNSYWAKVIGPNGWPIELWPLMPQFVRALPDRQKFIRAYVYGRGTEVEQEFDAASIAHFKRPNPKGDMFYGLSDLDACIDDADLSAAITVHNLTMLDNGGTPSAIITAKKADKRQTDELEARLNQKYGGVSKAGRIWVIRGEEVDVNVLANTGGKEMPYIVTDQQCRDTIAACFDVPVQLLTLEHTQATGKQGVPDWQRYGVRPRAQRIEDRINESIVPDFAAALNDPSLFVAFDNAVEEDDAASVTNATAMFEGLLATRDEARAIAGMEGAAEGGDEYWTPAFNPDAPTPGGDFGSGGKFPATGNRSDEPPPKKSLHGYESSNPFVRSDPGHKADQPRSDAETALASMFEKFLHGQTPAIVAQIRTHPGRPVAMILEEMGFDKALIKAVGNELTAIFGRGYDHAIAAMPSAPAPATEGGGAAGADAGAAEASGPDALATEQPNLLGSFSLENREAVAFLDAYKVKLARSVTSSLGSRLSELVQDGLKEGATIPEITAAVNNEMVSLAPYAAERIARTETARAYMHGREAAWSNSGDVTKKEWLLSGNPCPVCRAMAAEYKYAPIGRPFIPLGGILHYTDGGSARSIVMDYSEVQGPPVHPNCACSMGAVFEGDE